MNNDNVADIRNAYAVAERKDLEGWISLFTPDGVFTDKSVGATYRGRAFADPVRNFGTAFSNMHRELYRIYADGNVVVVQLALRAASSGRSTSIDRFRETCVAPSRGRSWPVSARQLADTGKGRFVTLLSQSARSKGAGQRGGSTHSVCPSPRTTGDSTP